MVAGAAASVPVNSGRDEDVLAVPLQNLANVENVSSSSSQHVINAPLLEQPRPDDVYRLLDGADRAHSGSEGSESLETELVDMLAHDGWSWGR